MNVVEFLNRKMAQIEVVVKEEAQKVARERTYATPDDEPIYCIDDDYHHPLTGNPMVVITMAEMTRRVLKRHQPGFADAKFGSICGDCRHPWPCPTVRELAEGWGWREEFEGG